MINARMAAIRQTVLACVGAVEPESSIYYRHKDEGYYLHDELTTTESTNLLQARLRDVQRRIDDEVVDDYLVLPSGCTQALESVRVRSCRGAGEDLKLFVIAKLPDHVDGDDVTREVLVFRFSRALASPQALMENLALGLRAKGRFQIRKLRAKFVLFGRPVIADNTLSGCFTRATVDKIVSVSGDGAIAPHLDHLASSRILEFERPLIGWTQGAERRYQRMTQAVLGALRATSVSRKLRSKYRDLIVATSGNLKKLRKETSQ